MPGTTVGLAMAFGDPGTGSRNDYPEISPRPADPQAPYPIYFGDAVFGRVTSNPPISGGLYTNAKNYSASFNATSHTTTVIDGISSLTNPNLTMPTLSTLFNGSAPQVGMLVLGPGLSAGTTIVSVGTNSLTLSNPTTTSTSSIFTITSPWLVSNTFIGVAMRQVQTMMPYNNSSGLFGSYPPGVLLDVLQKGSVSILAPIVNPITPWGAVYLVVGVDANQPYLQVGQYQSQPDGLYTIQLPNCQFREGVVDQNGVCEMSIIAVTNA